MSRKDPDFERLKDYDFADAKPASAFHHLVKHQLDGHPIDPAMRVEIGAKLTTVEREYGVRVLFACESGSRGWGFASADSDYDVRFIYVHPLAWYLQVSPPRDVIELPVAGLLDINGWELRKALGLLKKGNATLTEWLDSPVIYRADESFLRAMREQAAVTHRPERSFHHYVHMARGNFREYLRGDEVRLKKYLYVLRPLLAALWIEQGRGLAPMRFQTLADSIVPDELLRDEIRQLLERKRHAGELEYGPPLPRIQAFLERELARLELLAFPKPPESDFSGLDALLYQTVTGP